MQSPDRPGVIQLEAKQVFWKCIAEGMQSEAAAATAGTKPAAKRCSAHWRWSGCTDNASWPGDRPRTKRSP